MNFLTSTAVNLDFNPMAFVDNLQHMGVLLILTVSSQQDTTL